MVPVLNPGDVCVVLGTQWGDEGKGKLVDTLASECDIIARCAGGDNAGHTVVFDGVTYDFHLLPSGICHNSCLNIIGNGVVLNVESLFAEIESNEHKGLTGWESRLIISDRAHLVFSMHRVVDSHQEAEKRISGADIGTTGKGIGPSYSSKLSRQNLRVCDLIGDFDYFERRFRALAQHYTRAYPGIHVDVEEELQLCKKLSSKLRPLVRDTIVLLNNAVLSNTQKILIEGANAHMLDVDFGTYPFVTSSNCSVGGACTGLGIPPTKISKVIGVVKSYTTRVGGGKFPTEQVNVIGEKLQQIGREVGVTTGRTRRCGWLDLVVLKYAHMVNDFSSIMLTKLDVLDTFETIKIGVSYKLHGNVIEGFPSDINLLSKVDVEYIEMAGWQESISNCRKFEELPENAKLYVKKVEDLLSVPVQWIGVGPSREATIRLF
ncbi:adenylosuccinate synthetase isozyme 1 A-like [Zophobas morio]|jgi:adenylosuccinate synthase|uniref:adenylosuccinate synthetase isozyme 1 A-like n=1 Tax=Zophobas morio TaxID=2755281 RepID=UPI003083A6C7